MAGMFDEYENCPFCFRSKLTKIHRFPIEKVAEFVLQARPGVGKKQLVHIVGRYAREDAYAESMNESFNVFGSKTDLCQLHEDKFQSSAKQMAEYLETIKRLEEALAACELSKQRESQALRHKIKQLKKDLELEDLDDEEREGLLRVRSLFPCHLHALFLHSPVSCCQRADKNKGKSRIS